jgi:hypothetical protein
MSRRGIDLGDVTANHLDALPGEAVEGASDPAGGAVTGHQPEQGRGEQVVTLPVYQHHPMRFGELFTKGRGGDHAADSPTKHQDRIGFAHPWFS